MYLCDGQVVRDYKRANTLIRPTPTSAKVWVDLYAEIEKVSSAGTM